MVGKDLHEAQKLQKKHRKLEAELEGHQPMIDKTVQQGGDYVRENHPQAVKVCGGGGFVVVVVVVFVALVVVWRWVELVVPVMVVCSWFCVVALVVVWRWCGVDGAGDGGVQLV